MKEELIAYRLKRAKETLEDALLLAENEKWNSTINHLYYAAYYITVHIPVLMEFPQKKLNDSYYF